MITSAVFYADGEEIGIDELFQYYEPLKGLSSLKPRTLRDTFDIDIYMEKRERIINGWAEKLPDEMKGVIVEDGIEKEYEIHPRSDIKEILKPPNIFHMQSRDGERKIIREARKYPEDFLSYFKDCCKYFKRNKHDDDWYNAVGEKNLEPNKSKKIRFIPEPNLVSALESIYYEESINRITPEMTVIDIDRKGNKLWYIRDFLPSMMDTEFPSVRLGRYFGTLHGLKLGDGADRQWVHYCYQGDDEATIVNIDPDFVLNFENGSYLDSELGEVRSGLKNETPHRVTEDDIRKFNHHYRISREDTSEKIEEFIDYVPIFLDEDIFPYWGKVDSLCTTHELRKKYSK